MLFKDNIFVNSKEIKAKMMKKIKSVLVLSLVVALLVSCSQKVVFPVSSVIPSADAVAKIKKDKNNNYQIDLAVKNLTSPDRLSPPRQMYVVWIQTDLDTINLGQLKSSKSVFSSSRNASMTTTTPHKPSRFIITAEDQANINEPGLQVVLESAVENQ